MRARHALIGGAGLGAGVMLRFDLATRRCRRAWLGDQRTHLARRAVSRAKTWESSPP
jgi:hypothetical protein